MLTLVIDDWGGSCETALEEWNWNLQINVLETSNLMKRYKIIANILDTHLPELIV